MFINSIRWRLQIWYGLILVAVLAGFGATAYQLERGRVLRRIDDELHRRAGVLVSSLPPPPGDGMRPDDAPPGQEPPQPLRESPPNPPEPGPRPIDEPADLDAVQPPKDFHLPPQVATLFDENDTNSFYYVFTWRDGREFARSANAPWLKSPFHVMTSRLDATKGNTGPVVPQYLPGPQPREYNGEAQGGVEVGPPRFLMGGRPRMQRYRS